MYQPNYRSHLKSQNQLSQAKSDISTLLRIEKPFDVFRDILGKDMSLAIWRLPNDNEITGIIDLRPGKRVESIALRNSEEGFILNPFAEHHPAKPDFIKGDIKVKIGKSGDLKKLDTNPVLGEKEFEAFKKDLNKPGKSTGVLTSFPTNNFISEVESAIEEIRKKSFGKVVLSRFKDIELPGNFDPIELFKNSVNHYPNAFMYLLYHPDRGTWFGASPETLISIEGSHFKTVSLAGTQKLEQDQPLSDIAWTQKEIEEQAFVSRYVIDCFKKIRLREFEEYGPRTVKAGNLAHLKTEYHVEMDEVNMPNLGDIMLDLLHPTSAVCGMPLIPSLEFIKKMEGYDRELYSGFLGPVNVDDSTHIFVNLRCMKVSDTIARLYAGAGITEDSNPQKEQQETEIKMKTIHDLILQ